MSGWQMAQFFSSKDIRFRALKTFLVEQRNGSSSMGWVSLRKKAGHFSTFRKNSQG
jgi:hypothetical protein